MTTTTYPAAQIPSAAFGSVAHRNRGDAVVILFTSVTPLSEPYGTNDHLGFSIDWPLEHRPSTSWVISAAPASRKTADEVRELRDRITHSTGLSRQEIARAIGVDRRSLSGYVSGEIRPTEDRLRSLREFGEIAEWAVDRFGDYARELLRGASSGDPPLDLVRELGYDVRPVLETGARSLLATQPPAIRTTSRSTRPPLHTHALSVWTHESVLPTRGGTPRDPETYDQDLSAAPRAHDQQARPRRRQI